MGRSGFAETISHIIYPFLDEKWGERVVAVVQPRVGRTVDIAALSTFVKQQIGGVKTPKQIEVWDNLPRSKVGKLLKSEIRARLLANGKN